MAVPDARQVRPSGEHLVDCRCCRAFAEWPHQQSSDSFAVSVKPIELPAGKETLTKAAV
jgi:hypothetical protein